MVFQRSAHFLLKLGHKKDDELIDDAGQDDVLLCKGHGVVWELPLVLLGAGLDEEGVGRHFALGPIVEEMNPAGRPTTWHGQSRRVNPPWSLKIKTNQRFNEA